VVLVTNPATKGAIRKVAFDQVQPESASHLLVFCARPDTKDRAEEFFANARRNGAPEENIAQMRKKVRLGNLVNTLTFSRKAWATHQAYIALGYATMTAAQLGIDCCPMEGFFPSKVAKILNLPKGLSPVVLLAVGYRSPTDKVRPKYRLSSAELIVRV
jgi:nitroreductase